MVKTIKIKDKTSVATEIIIPLQAHAAVLRIEVLTGELLENYFGLFRTSDNVIEICGDLPYNQFLDVLIHELTHFFQKKSLWARVQITDNRKKLSFDDLIEASADFITAHIYDIYELADLIIRTLRNVNTGLESALRYTTLDSSTLHVVDSLASVFLNKRIEFVSDPLQNRTGSKQLFYLKEMSYAK